jgi:hypothetical protein
MPGFTTFCSLSIGILPMRRAGCALCCGVLHSARYWRKPRGRACDVGPEHDRRFSFCCAVDGCRSRATPPSLRFLGRKVYLATIVVLVSMMQLPVLFGVLDDRSRLACHLQWYLTENAENIAHGLSQAFQKRGLPRSARATTVPP